jgi:tetratricopeptide (TPR) repeat protein
MRVRFKLLLGTGAVALALAASPSLVFAVDSQTPSSQPAAKSGTASKKAAKKKAPKQKKSEQQFIDGYKAAHAMIYQQHDYVGGMAALRALHRDDHPDVANLLGFTSRKLGHYGDAKVWYEKALAANPGHTLTWSYYGMWHAEQGNFLKARDHLAKIASLCGTECREYVMLKEVIEGTRVY